jgi:hypothetical protein
VVLKAIEQGTRESGGLAPLVRAVAARLPRWRRVSPSFRGAGAGHRRAWRFTCVA